VQARAVPPSILLSPAKVCLFFSISKNDEEAQASPRSIFSFSYETEDSRGGRRFSPPFPPPRAFPPEKEQAFLIPLFFTILIVLGENNRFSSLLFSRRALEAFHFFRDVRDFDAFFPPPLLLWKKRGEVSLFPSFPSRPGLPPPPLNSD